MVARNASACKRSGIKIRGIKGVLKMPACIDVAADPGLRGSMIPCDQTNVTRPM